MNKNSFDTPVALGVVAFALSLIAAWVTHLVWIIQTLAGPAGITGGQLILACLGAFVPPLGIMHGIMIWFGQGF